jgi:hypothetical protein
MAILVATAVVAVALMLPASAFAAPPTVTLTAPTPANNALLNVNSVSIGFAADAVAPATIASTACKLDAAPAASCHSPRPYSPLAEGPHTVTVTATDSNGEVAAAVVAFRVDTTMPVVTIDSPTEGQQLWGGAADISFFARDGGAAATSSGIASIQCHLDGGAVGVCPASFANRPTGLSDGTHNYSVTATDAAGNATTLVRNFSMSESSAPPAIGFELSTNRATAHPDARITVSNTAGNQGIKSMRLRLPKGFWGSLAAAPKCDYAAAQSNTCAPANQIGSVDVDALIDASDARLRGKLYLTTPSPANVNNDPAGITVIVPTVVGGVDLGIVTVNARVQVRNAPVPGGAAGVVGPIDGMDALVESVPNSHTDLVSGRTITFKLKSMAIDLTSDLDGPNQPLLTNPSTCGSVTFAASITSYDNKTASVVDPAPDNITGCDTIKFNPTFDMVATTPNAGGTTGLLTDITLPPDSASFKSINVRFPASVGPAFPSFGSAADQCDSSSATSATAPFNPALCPPQAKFGTLTLDTPLLPGPPLQGNVYLINKSPLPWFGIDINPSVSPTNPKGVTIRVVGQSATPPLDPACDSSSGDFCQTQISVTFAGIPDAPTSKISMNVNGPNRVGIGGVVLSGKLLTVADPSDANCQPKDEYTASMLNNAGTAIRGDRVKTQAFTGCNARAISIDDGVGSPIGKTVTSTQPSIPYSGAADDCFFDASSSPATCGSPVTSSVPLSKNIHRVFIGSGSQHETRAFVVAAAPGAVDSTAPTTDFSPPPAASIAVATPTFDFSSNESSAFQCAIGPGSDAAKIGAFEPCNPSAGNSTTGSFTVAGGDELVAGKTYTIAVRAQDAAGNVDQTPASATFTVDVPYSTGLDYSISTTAARANPDFDLTISNPSHEDVRDVTLTFPDGFFGGLTGAESLCPADVAPSGNCQPGSQIGTIDTEVAIDESTIRLSGPVFLTDPLVAGDVAGLSIKLPAVLQSVDLGDIVVLGRVHVRGQAQGLDTAVVQIPNHINPAVSGNNFDDDTAFDLRRMTLKLRTNPGASYPLLTNASSCIHGKFDASTIGYNGTPGDATEAYNVTDCDTLPFSATLATSIVKEGTSDPPGFHDMVQLSATVTSTASDSALKNVAFTMPAPISIVTKQLGPICEQSEYESGGCPESTRVGTASAISPLLFSPLSGGVYLLRAVAPYFTPRLLITLRGSVSVDVIGVNSFVNGSQVLSAFTLLPDVPFTTFNMTYGGLLSVAYDPCDSSPNNWMMGLMVAHNEKSNTVKSPLAIKQGCPKLIVNAKGAFGKGKKAKFTVRQPGGGAKTTKFSIKLPRGATYIKAAVAKKITVVADGKKIKPKCWKASASTLVINFCGKKVGGIVVTAKPGSILTKKSIAQPKLVTTRIDTDKKTWHRTVKLKG